MYYGVYTLYVVSIAAALYISLFIVALAGVLLFRRIGRNQIALWWVSLLANIFVFLILLGGYGTPAYIMQFLSIFIWPLINIVWLIYIIIQEKKRITNNVNDIKTEKNNLKKTIIKLAIITTVVVLIFLFGSYYYMINYPFLD